MIRVMFDSDQLDALPTSAPLIATYSDLLPNPDPFAAGRPNQQLLLIDRGQGDPSGRASIADVETGALTVQDLPGWLARKRADGVQQLTVYCDRATLPLVDALPDLGAIFRWVATLDGTAHIDGYRALQGPAAVQTTGTEQLGIHADLSIVLEPGWHPAPEPDWQRRARAEAAHAVGNSNQLARDLEQLSTILSARH